MVLVQASGPNSSQFSHYRSFYSSLGLMALPRNLGKIENKLCFAVATGP